MGRDQGADPALGCWDLSCLQEAVDLGLELPWVRRVPTPGQGALPDPLRGDHDSRQGTDAERHEDATWEAAASHDARHPARSWGR